MSISPGSRIGPYEVIAQLGEGGMGVVFRGRDSRLQRDVALKLLPEYQIVVQTFPAPNGGKWTISANAPFSIVVNWTVGLRK